MTEKEFNLIDEPWIKVINMQGREEEVSLLDFYKRAHQFKTLAGELPTQDVAVLRLLLAILYAVFTRVDTEGNAAGITSTGEALERWKQLWEMGVFLDQAIEQYLRYYEERFYLFHPETPFYQVAGLTKGTAYTTAKFVGDLSESNNKVRLFPVRSGKAKKYVDNAEAIRWLLYLNAYDDTSSKPSVRGKGMPSVGAGWLGKLGLIFASGKSLFETLMLNFVLIRDSTELFEKGVPVWECVEVNGNERVVITQPSSPVELLTIQSRRILLQKDGCGNIIGYKLLGGDVFARENAFTEQMTLWRNEGKKREVVFIPKRHNSARQIWRDFASLILNSESDRPPGVVNWIAYLKGQTLIKNNEVRFQIASVKYGDKDFFVEDVFSDSISMNINLLTKIGTDWIPKIIKVLEITDQCVWQLGTLAYELAAASGNDDTSSKKGISATAREQAYFSLDIPFRNWLARINPETDDMDKTMFAWLEQMKKIILQQGEQLVKDAGEKAFTGIYKKDADRGVTTIKTAPKAYLKFKASINKIIRG